MNEFIPELRNELTKHSIRWIHETTDLHTGDICLILGFEKILKTNHLAFHVHNIVVHASDLPKGRGMSPLSWQILEGKNVIPLTLFEAVESVDAGNVYIKDQVCFAGHELISEMRRSIGKKICDMCTEFVNKYPTIIGEGSGQVGEPTYYPRRTDADSRLDVDKTIREQFDLLRIVDNDKYPAYFEIHGHRYVLKIEKDTRVRKE